MNTFRDWELKEAEKSWDDMYFDNENVPRWKSNNSVPMNDMLDMWKFLGKDFDYDKAVEARQKQVEIELAQYRNHQSKHEYSQEEIYEMKSAFGNDAVVVDILTGKEIFL